MKKCIIVLTGNMIRINVYIVCVCGDDVSIKYM